MVALKVKCSCQPSSDSKGGSGSAEGVIFIFSYTMEVEDALRARLDGSGGVLIGM